MVAASHTVDRVLTALADPTRRAILSRLARGESLVTELADALPVSQPAVSKHLKVLERAGLVSRGREGVRRPCRMELGPLLEVTAWLEEFRHVWEANYRRLDALLDEMKTLSEGG